jgi:hypothetical protein
MKKGQGLIGFVFFIIVFIFIWAIFLSKWLSEVGNILIAGGATGILAFIYANLNFLVLIGLILLIIIGMMSTTQ